LQESSGSVLFASQDDSAPYTGDARIQVPYTAIAGRRMIHCCTGNCTETFWTPTPTFEGDPEQPKVASKDQLYMAKPSDDKAAGA
jgi:hypothetical protein